MKITSGCRIVFYFLLAVTASSGSLWVNAATSIDKSLLPECVSDQTPLAVFGAGFESGKTVGIELRDNNGQRLKYKMLERSEHRMLIQLASWRKAPPAHVELLIREARNANALRVEIPVCQPAAEDARRRIAERPMAKPESLKPESEGRPLGEDDDHSPAVPSRGGMGAPLALGPTSTPIDWGELAHSSDDPHYIEGELVLLSPSMKEAQKLTTVIRSVGATIVERKKLGAIGAVITTVKLATDEQLQGLKLQIEQSTAGASMARNHTYRPLSDRARRWHLQSIGWPGNFGVCQPTTAIGVIDTATSYINGGLGSRLTKANFVRGGETPADPRHGNSVLSIIAGVGGDAGHQGMLPQAEIVFAAAFHKTRQGPRTTTRQILLALNWIAEQAKVRVINMSLGGPYNKAIEYAVQQLSSLGIQVVAAAGTLTLGEQRLPLYPAAQAVVIAVTAVDALGKPFSQEVTGDYIDWSAPGVDVWVPTGEQSGYFATGSSYAAPMVSAILASSDADSTTGSLAELMQYRDLGVAGKDPVFGHGLVTGSRACPIGRGNSAERK